MTAFDAICVSLIILGLAMRFRLVSRTIARLAGRRSPDETVSKMWR